MTQGRLLKIYNNILVKHTFNNEIQTYYIQPRFKIAASHLLGTFLVRTHVLKTLHSLVRTKVSIKSHLRMNMLFLWNATYIAAMLIVHIFM